MFKDYIVRSMKSIRSIKSLKVMRSMKSTRSITCMRSVRSMKSIRSMFEESSVRNMKSVKCMTLLKTGVFMIKMYSTLRISSITKSKCTVSINSTVEYFFRCLY